MKNGAGLIIEKGGKGCNEKRIRARAVDNLFMNGAKTAQFRGKLYREFEQTDEKYISLRLNVGTYFFMALGGTSSPYIR
jgi:hypothetical protein